MKPVTEVTVPPIVPILEETVPTVPVLEVIKPAQNSTFNQPVKPQEDNQTKPSTPISPAPSKTPEEQKAADALPPP